MPFPNGSIQLTGTIGTTDITDTFATHQDYLGFGGMRSVPDDTARDLITVDRRTFGMLVFSVASNTCYVLADVAMGGNSNTLTDNLNWIVFSSGGGGTITGITNSGLGAGLANGVTGSDVVVKSLIQGNNVTITDNGADITIAASSFTPPTGADFLIGQTSGYISNPSALTGNNETWLGNQAGASVLASSAQGSTFIGPSAGSGALNASSGTFVGNQSGAGASNAVASVFVGLSAGSSAINASNAIFLGQSAGDNATNGQAMIAIGRDAGKNTPDNQNSIFIGESAGTAISSTVSGNNSNIAIGYFSTPGAFTNTVVLGNSAYANANNQFSISDSVTNFKMRAIDYTMPNALGTGGSNYVLTDAAGNGVLSWAIPSGGTITGIQNSGIGTGLANGVTGTDVIVKSLVQGTNIIITDNGPDITIAANSYLPPTGADFLIGQTSGRISNPGFVTADEEVFLGQDAGSGGTANATVFIGFEAGKNATGAANAVAVGRRAGTNTSSNNSIFLGYEAGSNATQSINSVMIGFMAGQGATTSNEVIAIGHKAGFNDTVNNNIGADSSILIGRDTNTGGFKNSIAMGKAAVNTRQNQFLVAPSYSNFQFVGLDYLFPSAYGTGGSSYALVDNTGTGNLVWQDLGTIGAALTATYIGYGSGSNTLTGDSDFTRQTTGSKAIKMKSDSLAGPYVQLDMDGSLGNQPFKVFSTNGITESTLAVQDSLGTGGMGLWYAAVSQPPFVGIELGGFTSTRLLKIYNNNRNWLWPDVDGTTNQAMVTDGSGNLSFASVSSLLPPLSQYHIYVGDASNLPVDGGPNLIFNDTVSFQSKITNTTSYESLIDLSSTYGKMSFDTLSGVKTEMTLDAAFAQFVYQDTANNFSNMVTTLNFAGGICTDNTTFYSQFGASNNDAFFLFDDPVNLKSSLISGTATELRCILSDNSTADITGFRIQNRKVLIGNWNGSNINVDDNTKLITYGRFTPVHDAVDTIPYGTSYVAAPSFEIFFFSTASGASSIDISDPNFINNSRITIIDGDGISSTSNITIDAGAGSLINGLGGSAQTLVINNNFTSVTLQKINGNWQVI